MQADDTGAINISLADEAATARLAGVLAGLVKVGDLLVLRGGLGVGKTALVRALIRHLTDAAQIVPSPSFTLVQPYETRRGALLHADFYRLNDPQEVLELGLLEALGDHICCVEWPENAAGFLPAASFDITLEMAASGTASTARTAHITASKQAAQTALSAALARADALADFIRQAGWGAAMRTPLAGDASTRRYERLTGEDKSAVLMDWMAAADGPPIYDGQSYSKIVHLAESAPAYCRVTRWLAAHDIAVPCVLAADERSGFVLLEDCGDVTLANDMIDIDIAYFEAVSTLLALHTHSAADFLAAYDGRVQAIETGLFLDWYLPWRGIEIDAAACADWMRLWEKLGDTLRPKEPVTVLRDFHSPNLLWRGERQGHHRLTVIDVQDALAGSPAYDMASLLQDARMDVAPDRQQAILAQYTTTRFGHDAKAKKNFARDVALAGAQRNFKIAGIFCRLAVRDGKPAYLDHLPRICRYLSENLAHAALSEVRDWLNTHAPNALEPVS